MIEKMRLFSSIFISKKKEGGCIETPKWFQGEESYSETSRRFRDEEQGACTSCSHGARGEQESPMEHEILSGYLAAYKCQPRTVKESLDVP